eukprot:Skav221507  [mRNA]  locus=scaffold2743:160975:162827:- [translate_table: standard]
MVTALPHGVDGSPSFWEIAFDRIVLQDSVGQGVTAHVYQAILDGQYQVAVKQINDMDKSTSSEKDLRAFEREVAVLMRTNHPNLVRFLGISSVQRPFRIITEYCAGGCVFSLLHNQEFGSKFQFDSASMSVFLLTISILHNKAAFLA